MVYEKNLMKLLFKSNNECSTGGSASIPMLMQQREKEIDNIIKDIFK